MKLVYDEFNSSIFNLEMANIILDRIEPTEDVKDFIKNSIYEHLSVKIDTEDKQSLNIFLINGFYLVDTQVTYEYKVLNIPKLQAEHVRDMNIKDLKEVLDIARESFSIDRFHSDFNLDWQKANSYYENWANNLFTNKDNVSHVFEENGTICGFSFWSIKDKNATLILIAVEKNQRMKGVYKNLINYFIENFAHKINVINMGTQINNYGVHKYWGTRGAYIKSSKYVLHYFKK